MASMDDALRGKPRLHRMLQYKLSILQETTSNDLQAVENLRRERRLPPVVWIRMAKRLRRTADTATEIRGAIRETLRAATLSGDQVHHGAPVYGRAVTHKALCSLFQTLKYANDAGNAARMVRRMLARPVDRLRTRWRDRDLGRYLMWSTFSLDGKGPFDALDDNDLRIRGRLGLDRDDVSVPLLLFEYDVPAAVERLFPTVADAYASDDWPYYFRPAPESAVSGLTLAWDKYRNEGPPLPEVVHSVLQFSVLTREPREAR